jgi:methyl-accepting chemotaxis protein
MLDELVDEAEEVAEEVQSVAAANEEQKAKIQEIDAATKRLTEQ